MLLGADRSGRLSSNDIRSATSRFIAMMILWLILVEGDRYNVWFGMAIAAGAALVSLLFIPKITFHPLALIGFVPFFLHKSIIGGIDVAKRAFDPRMPIDPGFAEFPLSISSERGRVFIANTMSLLPGTVSVEVLERSLRLHLLDRTLPVHTTLQVLETHVASLLGEELDPE